MRRAEALPSRERERLLQQVPGLEREAATRSSGCGTKHVRWPDLESRANRILGDPVLPNLVVEGGEEVF
jgi:hypothetical protein